MSPLGAGWGEGADLVVSGILGLIFGSFANVCIHRIPNKRSIVWPASSCPSCGATIRWFDNIPVISWLALRGRCRTCRAAIPIRYPAVEISSALLLVALCAQHGLTLRWAALSYMALSVLVLIPIDLDLGILPDKITLTGTAAGMGFALFTKLGWQEALMGAAVGAGVPLVLRAGYIAYARLRDRGGGSDAPGEPEDAELAARRREGMGLGDVKMLAMVGAFLGLPRVLLTIVLGSMIGTLTVVPLLLLGRLSMKSPVPFGPFLGVAALISMFWGTRIIAWYLHLALPLPVGG
ncbi:MAG: prepilin peptidase [Acidobacteriota bacterium]